MKIGIIIFSRTGNTLAVAEKIKDACQQKGHTVEIQRIAAQNEDPNNQQPVRLVTAPNSLLYDAVIFGAPVQGFSLTPIMKAYLTQLPQQNGKKVSCFVTQHFPYPWMGGSRALRQMCDFCKERGAHIVQTGIVNWTAKARDSQIENVAFQFSGM